MATRTLEQFADLWGWAAITLRAEYPGHGRFDHGPNAVNTYLRSNITTASIRFPLGYGIAVGAGKPIDIPVVARNGALIDVKVGQDGWLNNVPLD